MLGRVAFCCFLIILIVAGSVKSELRCASLVQLGEQCQSGYNSLMRCEPAFSSCQRGRCSCMDGFLEVDGHCIPQVASCPGQTTFSPTPCSVFFDDCDKLYCKFSAEGEACDILPRPPPPAAGITTDASSLSDRLVNGFGCLPHGHSPLYTVAQNNTNRRRKRHDSAIEPPQSCPAGQFCYIHSSYIINECKVRAFGHCCPHSCPVGLPHPTASCARDARVPCQQQEGYYCRRSFLTEPVVKTFGRAIDQHFLASCCPSHCPHGMVAANDGHCIPKADMGEACWREEQCPYTLSCVKGLCQCEPGKVMDFSIGFRCVDKKRNQLQLGDQCESSSGGDSYCGVDHSICEGRICVCACGFEQTGNRCTKKFGPCPGDRHSECFNWANEGECQRNPDWMKPNCAESCDAC